MITIRPFEFKRHNAVDRRRPEFSAAHEASARARPRRLSVDDLDGELDLRVLREISSNESSS